MLKSVITLALLISTIMPHAHAQFSIGGEEGATVESIIENKSLVTIILDGDLEDVNLTINKISGTLLKFTSSNGSKNVYPLSMVQEINIQASRVPEKTTIRQDVVLTRAEMAIVKRALERTEEIFVKLKTLMNSSQWTLSHPGAESVVEVKMALASMLAVSGNEYYQDYLQGLLESGNVDSAIPAATNLLHTGVVIPDSLIKEAFSNGERITRASAARIVSLTGKQKFIPELRKMAKDPSPEIYPSAIRALGTLGDRESLEDMYKGLTTLSQPKAEAAIFALTQLGGDDVIAHLNMLYVNAKNIEKFRILRLLYVLGDDDAVNAMRDIGLNTVAYDKASALVLAENSDWDGINWIRGHLTKAKDPNMDNLLYQGYAAKAIYNTAPNESMKILQELTRITPREIYAKGHNKDENYKTQTANYVQGRACNIIGSLGDKSMLTLLSTKLEDKSLLVSLAACDAVLMITNIEYRDRRNNDSQFMGTREMLLKDFFK